MWCAHCRCEVPVAVSSGADEIRCAMCREPMPGGTPAELTPAPALPQSSIAQGASEAASDSGPLLSATAELPPVEMDDWEMRIDLLRAQWLLQPPPPPDAADMGELFEHSFTAAAVGRLTNRPSALADTWSVRLGRTILWLVLCLGAMALAFGGGLLGCKTAGLPGDLWGFGLVTALAGQLVLLMSIAGLFALRRTSGHAMSPAEALHAHDDLGPVAHFAQPRPPLSKRSRFALSLPLDV